MISFKHERGCTIGWDQRCSPPDLGRVDGLPDEEVAGTLFNIAAGRHTRFETRGITVTFPSQRDNSKVANPSSFSRVLRWIPKRLTLRFQPLEF
jgi:hypothetical protein